MQTVLVGMYVFAVVEAGRPCFENQRIYVYYVLGILTQVGYTLVKFYLMRFHRTYHYWRVILTRPRDSRGYLAYHAGNWETSLEHVHRNEIWIRFFFSVLINEVGLVAVFALLPIQLASSADPMDFVMNCVAAYFIVELDDTDDTEILLPSSKEIREGASFLTRDDMGSTEAVEGFLGSGSVAAPGNREDNVRYGTIS